MDEILDAAKGLRKIRQEDFEKHLNGREGFMGSTLLTAGLVLIILGWLVQFYYSVGRKLFALSLKFVVIYVVGCILLAIDALQKGGSLTGVLILVVAALAFVSGVFAKKARKYYKPT